MSVKKSVTIKKSEVKAATPTRKKSPSKKASVTKEKKPPTKETAQKGPLVDIDQFAELVGVTTDMIRKYEQQGIIKSEPKKNQKDKRMYDFTRNIVKLVRFFREKTDSRKSGDSEEMEKAKLKRMEMKLKKEELELAELENDLHRSSDIEKVIGAALTRLRINLLSIPMGIAPLVREKKNVNEIAEIINERICRALNETASVDIDKMLAEEEG